MLGRIRSVVALASIVAASEALSVELEIFGTSNGVSNPIEETDYGAKERTGGDIAGGGVTVDGSILSYELRYQRVRQWTAWSDNAGGSYRDGYRYQANEILVGPRWRPFPSLLVAALIGGGVTAIEYETRVVSEEAKKISVRRAEAPHAATQLEARYRLPLPIEPLALSAVTMLRVSALKKHGDDATVASATWSVNVPNLPLLALGIVVGVTL